MTQGDDQLGDDFGTGPDAEQSALADRLRAARPVPSAAFRGELRRRLATPRRSLSRARVRGLIAAYSASGTVLLLVGAISAAGHGPIG